MLQLYLHAQLSKSKSKSLGKSHVLLSALSSCKKSSTQEHKHGQAGSSAKLTAPGATAGKQQEKSKTRRPAL